MSRNKHWMVGDSRWNPRERQRTEERFRRFVRTKSNPEGRIERQPCPFCRRENLPGLAPKRPSEFHHLDYQNPFLGVWCCTSHHRRIEHGSAVVLLKDVWDYSSVVAPLLRPCRKEDQAYDRTSHPPGHLAVPSKTRRAGREGPAHCKANHSPSCGRRAGIPARKSKEAG